MDSGSSEKGPKTTRRALLRRIGVASGLAYVAPGLTRLGIANASGDDDDDDDDDDAPGGGSGNGGGTTQRRQARGRQQPAPRQTGPRAAPPPPPEIVVLLGLGQSLAPAVTAGYGILAEAETAVLSGRLARLGLPEGRSIEAALAELADLLPGVLADENHLYAPDTFACDGDDCAAQAMIGWSGWPSAMSPRIGMIDTGVNVDHPALTNQKLTVHQLDLDERDAAGRQHGTAIAAMLIGSVKGRVPGLLPYAELIAVEGFHRNAGTEVADAYSIVRAMEILLGSGASVINLSFSGPANAVFERMIIRAEVAGVAMVAAAGNGGPGAPPAFPAAWAQVIAVTAVDASERPYRQANRGPYVMLAAPGVNVWTAASVSGGRLRSGTSYAAPYVTAAIAVERLRAPDQPLAAVVEALFACARDLGDAGFDDVFGHGLLSAPGQCQGTPQDFFSVSGE